MTTNERERPDESRPNGALPKGLDEAMRGAWAQFKKGGGAPLVSSVVFERAFLAGAAWRATSSAGEAKAPDLGNTITGAQMGVARKAYLAYRRGDLTIEEAASLAMEWDRARRGVPNVTDESPSGVESASAASTSGSLEAARQAEALERERVVFVACQFGDTNKARQTHEQLAKALDALAAAVEARVRLEASNEG